MIRRARALSIGICLILAALVASCAGDRMSRSTEEAVDDSLLANKVRSYFKTLTEVSAGTCEGGAQVGKLLPTHTIEVRSFDDEHRMSLSHRCQR
jgi:hypothetical protein